MHPLDNASVSAVGQLSSGKSKKESSLSSVMKNKGYSFLAESLTIIICEESHHERAPAAGPPAGPPRAAVTVT